MNCIRLFHRIHNHKKVCLPLAKHISYHPFKFSESEKRWKENDGISKDYELIYKAPMEKPLNILTTYLAATSSLITAGTIYYATAVYDVNKVDAPVLLGDVIIANNGYECFVYLASFVVLHIAVKVTISKYLVRLYQNGDKYIAVFRGHIHNRIKKHEFERKDVRKLSTMLVVTWPDARYSIGKKHAIILDGYFKTPEHFNYLVNPDAKSDPTKDE